MKSTIHVGYLFPCDSNVFQVNKKDDNFQGAEVGLGDGFIFPIDLIAGELTSHGKA